MDDLLNIVVVVVAAIILIPAILAGGWIIAGFLIGLWLFVTKVLPELWDWFKQRQFGVSGAKRSGERRSGRDQNVFDRGEK